MQQHGQPSFNIKLIHQRPISAHTSVTEVLVYQLWNPGPLSRPTKSESLGERVMKAIFIHFLILTNMKFEKHNPEGMERGKQGITFLIEFRKANGLPW